jgi:putative oxygen-independent coproporphyrinogen III oxidase
MTHHPADAGFGIYIHWPFCASKCPYCDFNSHVRHQPVDEARFVAAFQREIAHMAHLAPGRIVSSLFFGGGTPSLMKPATVSAIIDCVARHWTLADQPEITLEANPTSVEAHRFQGYQQAGVNRVSLGVQALHDADLRALGRMHSVAEALTALKIAGSIFERYSYDLIYARPHQSLDSWAAELKQGLSYARDHISLYQLTIEPDTAFEKLRDAGKLIVPDNDHARLLYDLTQEICEQHNMPAYEISNHARLGAESRHNLIYWRHGEYVGVGPGAHGRLNTPHGRMATSTEKHPETWLERVESFGHGVIEGEVMTPSAEGDELLLMGLRLREGIDPQRFTHISGRTLDAKQIKDLIHNGFVAEDKGRLRVTAEGFPVLDAVVADLAMVH